MFWLKRSSVYWKNTNFLNENVLVDKTILNPVKSVSAMVLVWIVFTHLPGSGGSLSNTWKTLVGYTGQILIILYGCGLRNCRLADWRLIRQWYHWLATCWTVLLLPEVEDWGLVLLRKLLALEPLLSVLLLYLLLSILLRELLTLKLLLRKLLTLKLLLRELLCWLRQGVLLLLRLSVCLWPGRYLIFR